MATAADCFKENVHMLGSPVNASMETRMQWNLNNGLRMLAEQMDSLQAENRQLKNQLQQMQHALARTSVQR